MITLETALFISNNPAGYPIGSLREAHEVIRMASPFTDDCLKALMAVHNAIATSATPPAIKSPCIECGGSGVQFARGRCEACNPLL